MQITRTEAVAMFARYCQARFGKKATQKVRARAKVLRCCRHTTAYEIWNKVADEIEKTKSTRAH